MVYIKLTRYYSIKTEFRRGIIQNENHL